eukprot:TRINITY_DN6792_c0_g1_i7.p1 TRINITY_DN6792_c0_g1~~TRINITY_DN6792_c0_g1_i7.p1  ORF type:complete len:334 (-),score=55.53 TRINITY_DN6792_c0_g1_i7:141-1142(-)
MYGHVSPWLAILTGVFTFVYLNFDNIDGKQARKTKSSSPLGLLFDHGCDALNSTVIVTSLCTVLQAGNTEFSLIPFIMAIVPFYTATWEEYYINGLFLPAIHGASEGVVLVSLLFIFSGLVGQEFWTSATLYGNLPNNILLVYVLALASFYSAASNVVTVFMKKRDRFGHAVGNLSPLTFLVLTLTIVHFYSPARISETHTRYFLYFFGLHFAKLATHLQIAHVATEEFRGLRRTSIFLYIVFIAHTAASAILGGSIFPEDQLLFVLLGLSVLVYAHLVVNVVIQFTNVLNIRAFCLKTNGSLINFSQKNTAQNASPFSYELTESSKFAPPPP